MLTDMVLHTMRFTNSCRHDRQFMLVDPFGKELIHSVIPGGRVAVWHLHCPDYTDLREQMKHMRIYTYNNDGLVDVTRLLSIERSFECTE